MENQHNPVVSSNERNEFSSEGFFKFEIKSLSFQELNQLLEKLKFVCLNFDPYQPEEIGPEAMNIMREFELLDKLNNPFDFTNAILQRMDLIETELETRKQ